MRSHRIGLRRHPLVVSLLLVGTIVTGTGATPAAATHDGPPTIGVEGPSVPQIHRPAGGGAVRIFGEGLLGTTAVTIGGVASPDIRVVDGDLVIAKVPTAGIPLVQNDGFAHITVTDDQGTSSTDLDGDGTVDLADCVQDNPGDPCYDFGPELGAIFYTDATLTLSPQTGLDGGETTTMTLTGHRPNQFWPFVHLGPLVNFLEDGPADPDTAPPGPAYGGPVSFITTDASGNATWPVTVQASPTFNSKDQDFDADGDCPVAQVSANYGLGRCILGYSEFGMASLETYFSYSPDAPNLDPVPAAPTLALTPTSGAEGATVSLSGANWNAAPHFGSGTTVDDPGETSLIVEVCNTGQTVCVPAGTQSASVAVTRYRDADPTNPCVSGASPPCIQPLYSGATLSGSITVPGGAGCAPSCLVRVRQQRHDIELNAPVAGSFITTTAPLTVTGPTFLSVNDVSVTEGNAGTTAASFTVSRSGVTTGASTVRYNTVGGTATGGSDYSGVGLTTLSFAAGETSKTATVQVIGDTVYEPDEAFSIALSAPTGATLSDASGTATIVNDDAVSYLAIDDVVVTEANAGTVTAAFSVTRSGNTAGSATVSYATSNGTATAGSDYTAIPLTPVTFAAGQTTKPVNVAVTGDTLDEANETFTVTLSAATGAVLSDAAGTGTIVDDEGAVTAGPATFLRINDVRVTEGNSGTTPATFTVTRTGVTTGVSTVKYNTVGGTATGGSDYNGVGLTTLTFAAGETSKPATVNVIGDTVTELTEAFSVALSAPTGGTVSDASGAATIVDNEPAYLSVKDLTAGERNSGSTVTTFTITRTGNTAGPATVSYATANGTALAGADYTAVALTPVTFTAGQTTKTVNVSVTGDTLNEPNETFTLTLSAATGATLSDVSATATIIDDD